MKTFTIAAICAVQAFGEAILPVALLEKSTLIDELHAPLPSESSDIWADQEFSDIVLAPEPTADYAVEAEKPPGEWTDEQQLTLETFKKVVTTDTQNVWVVAYIDPRCRDCLNLSIEWEHLTQIEEQEMRKVKLGYVDISVTENWQILQDHTKGRRITHTPQVTLYGDDKEHPNFYKEERPKAERIHTWVTSYADAYGYGYWNPDQYTGAGVVPRYLPYQNGYYHNPSAHYDGYGGYGGGYQQGGYAGYVNDPGYQVNYYDNPYLHEGSLQQAGVQVGYGGRGYAQGGKSMRGKQAMQIKTTDDSLVMRQQSLTQYTKLSGAAHGGDPKRKTYKEPEKSYGNYQGWGNGNYFNPYSSTGSYGGWGGNDSYSGYASPYGVQSYSWPQGQPYNQYSQGGQYNSYGGPQYGYDQSYHGYGNQRQYGGYGSYGGNSYGYQPVQKQQGYYGKPTTTYDGPGMRYLYGIGEKFDSVKGRGIILGKYSTTHRDEKETTDFDEVSLAGPDSQMYLDAYDLAMSSGVGYSSLTDYFHDDFGQVAPGEAVANQVFDALEGAKTETKHDSYSHSDSYVEPLENLVNHNDPGYAEMQQLGDVVHNKEYAHPAPLPAVEECFVEEYTGDVVCDLVPPPQQQPVIEECFVDQNTGDVLCDTQHPEPIQDYPNEQALHDILIHQEQDQAYHGEGGVGGSQEQQLYDILDNTHEQAGLFDIINDQHDHIVHDVPQAHPETGDQFAQVSDKNLLCGIDVPVDDASCTFAI